MTDPAAEQFTMRRRTPAERIRHLAGLLRDGIPGYVPRTAAGTALDLGVAIALEMLADEMDAERD